MFKFYLNNVLVTDPLNWFDFTETIERDDTINGLLPKYEIKLTFDSGGYKILHDAYLSSGFCNLIELKVEQKCNNGYDNILNGYIFLSDCEFNLNRCTVDCSIFDNNYGAKIYNNKNIKAYLDTTTSKNYNIENGTGVVITTCSADNVKFFTPTTGVYSATTRKVFWVYDAFRFLIDFMTDGTVGFESDYLYGFINTNQNYLGVIIGKEIRLHTGLSPVISFQELFDQVNKKYPIGFTIVNRGGVPTIKIENQDYFKNASTSVNIEYIDNLRQSFNNELLYSVVKFGEPTTYDNTINSFGEVQFLSFKEEEYHLQGECNIDKALDLTGNYFVNTNRIEEAFATNTSNDQYDEDIFLIEYSGAAGVYNAAAYVSLSTGALPYYYNGDMTNNKVAERYSLAGNVAIFLGNNSVGFRAEKTAGTQIGYSHSDVAGFTPPAVQTSADQVIVFENDASLPNYDTAGNFTLTYKYTSSISGDYVFQTGLNFEAVKTGLSTFINRKFRIVVEIRKYNSINVLQQIVQEQHPSSTTYYHIPNTAGPYYYNIVTGSQTLGLLYLASTDYALVSYYFISEPENYLLASSIQLRTRNGSYFTTTSTVTGGGVYKSEQPSNYFVSKFVFEKSLSAMDYATIKLDMSKAIRINHDGQSNRDCWIRKSTRKLATGEMSWELISNLTSGK